MSKLLATDPNTHSIAEKHFVLWVGCSYSWPRSHWLQVKMELCEREERRRAQDNRPLMIVCSDADHGAASLVRAVAKHILGCCLAIASDSFITGRNTFAHCPPPSAAIFFGEKGQSYYVFSKAVLRAANRRGSWASHNRPLNLRARLVTPWDDMTLIATMAEQPPAPSLGSTTP